MCSRFCSNTTVTRHLLRIDIHLATINGGKVEAVQIGGHLVCVHIQAGSTTNSVYMQIGCRVKDERQRLVTHTMGWSSETEGAGNSGSSSSSSTLMVIVSTMIIITIIVTSSIISSTSVLLSIPSRTSPPVQVHSQHTCACQCHTAGTYTKPRHCSSDCDSLGAGRSLQDPEAGGVHGGSIECKMRGTTVL